jgi:hypothetical protein
MRFVVMKLSSVLNFPARQADEGYFNSTNSKAVACIYFERATYCTNNFF